MMWKLLLVSVVAAVVTSVVAQTGSPFPLFGTGPPTDPGALGTFGATSPTSGGSGLSFMLPLLMQRGGMGEMSFPLMMMAMQNPQMMPLLFMNSGGEMSPSTMLMFSMFNKGFMG